MKKIKFYKMHGAGNDFVCLDNKKGDISLTKKEIKFICDRNFGVGADGVILMEKPTKGKGDIFMNYLNADGSSAKMCGNGARCTARFARKIWKYKKNKIDILTRSGIKPAILQKNNLVTINMGKPNFQQSKDFPIKPKVFGDIKFHFVITGEPHAIGFYKSEKLARKAFKNLAPEILSDLKNFPNEINVHIIWQKGPNHFAGLSLERHIGPTLACGTGMCSALIVLTEKLGKIKDDIKKVRIDTSGGSLFFEFNEKNEILMTGPAEFVFEGEIKMNN